jgi:hypothetical protein
MVKMMMIHKMVHKVEVLVHMLAIKILTLIKTQDNINSL